MKQLRLYAPLLFSAALVVALAVVIIWKKPGSAGASSAVRNEGANPIRIGIVLPLTGDGANYGKRCLNGISWAVDKINRSGGITGRKLVTVVEDSRSTPKDAVTAISKLISADHIKIVVGDIMSGPTLAMAPIAEQNKVVLLAPGASNPSLRDAGDFIFRDWTSDDYDGKAMADYLLKVNQKTVGLLVQKIDYAVGVADALAREFNALGGKVIQREEFETTETNLRTYLAKLKTAGVPNVYLSAQSQETGMALKQAIEIGYRPRWFTTLTVDTPECARIAGKARESVIFTTPAFDLSAQTPVMTSFVDGFKERFGQDPEAAAGHGYDAINILTRVISSVGTDPTDVKNELYKVRDFPGVTGNMSFDDHGDVLKPISIKQIKQGQPVLLEVFSK